MKTVISPLLGYFYYSENDTFITSAHNVIIYSENRSLYA